MHAITANKGPVVHAYQELTELAEKVNRRFLFEATVMDGSPLFSLWREALLGAKLHSFTGILNSTTNLMLTRMEAGESFQEALNHAQSIGLAESDPSGDVDGWDAAIKVAALVNVLMGIPLKPTEVKREGLRGMDAERVQASYRRGRRWKLLCQASLEGDQVSAGVTLRELEPTHPLYHVMGSSSAVTFHTDVLGALTITGSNPGPETTAFGLLADMLSAIRSPH
jgi:homoserine dehydrogenase